MCWDITSKCCFFSSQNRWRLERESKQVTHFFLLSSLRICWLYLPIIIVLFSSSICFTFIFWTHLTTCGKSDLKKPDLKRSNFDFNMMIFTLVIQNIHYFCVSLCGNRIIKVVNVFWVCLFELAQLRSLPGVEFRARRSRGGRGRRGWPSSRTSSWWTGSWWCRSPASTTSTPRRTSDTPTPWRRRARMARRRRTEADPCCSTSIKRWPRFYTLISDGSPLRLSCEGFTSSASSADVFFERFRMNYFCLTWIWLVYSTNTSLSKSFKRESGRLSCSWSWNIPEFSKYLDCSTFLQHEQDVFVSYFRRTVSVWLKGNIKISVKLTVKINTDGCWL